MSIALWAKLEDAEKRIKELETKLAQAAERDVNALHERILALENWVTSRKPGPKPKDGANG